MDLRSRSVQYTILIREADTNRSLYDGLLQQFRELGVTGDAQSNNVSVIDKAELPGARCRRRFTAISFWRLPWECGGDGGGLVD